MVTQSVSQDELEATALAWAQRLASGPTRAFGRCRELLLTSLSDTFETHLERESRMIADSMAEADGREGTAAFLAKRPPAFGGS